MILPQNILCFSIPDIQKLAPGFTFVTTQWLSTKSAVYKLYAAL